MQLFAEPTLSFLFIGGIIGTIFWLVTTLFVIWMLIDAITNAALDGTMKIIWVLVILFLHLIGALIYFFVARGGNVNRPRI